MNSPHGEPTLDEMLSDPIVRAVMEADGINPQELAATLRLTGQMLARRERRWAITIHAGPSDRRTVP
jgi:hypothetical protein